MHKNAHMHILGHQQHTYQVFSQYDEWCSLGTDAQTEIICFYRGMFSDCHNCSIDIAFYKSWQQAIIFASYKKVST